MPVGGVRDQHRDRKQGKRLQEIMQRPLQPAGDALSGGISSSRALRFHLEPYWLVVAMALTMMCTNPSTTLSASINNSVVMLLRDPCRLPGPARH